MSTVPPAAAQLRAQLGLAGALWLGLGSIFGTGVFVAIGLALDVTGDYVLAAVALAGLLALANALSSAQLAAAYPVSGGTYEYAYRLIDARVGFAAGWLFLLAKSASAATAALGVVAYANVMLGGPLAPGLSGPMAAALVLMVTALVASGWRRSTVLNAVLVSVTLVALLAFVAVALATSATETALAASSTVTEAFDLRDFGYATALMFVAYTGYGRLATLGEEVRDPTRTIPRAIVLTLAVSVVVYLLVAAGLVRLAPFTTGGLVGGGGQVLAKALSPLGLPTVKALVSVGAIAAMLGVLLNLLLGLSRVALAAGRRGDLPTSLARLDARSEPVMAVWAVGLAIAGLSLVGSVALTWAFSALTVLVYYGLTHVAALRLSPKQQRYPRWVAVAGLVACLGLTLFVPLAIWAVAVGLVAIGFGVRWAVRRTGVSA